MKRIRFSLLLSSVKFFRSFMGLAFFAGASVGSVLTLCAQTDGTAGASSDEITFATDEKIQDYSSAGKFAPVALNPLETTTIKLQFLPELASTPVIAQVLDGGDLGGIDESATIAPDGTTSFQFQVPDQPGLYRVLVIAGQTFSMVQFEVPPQAPEE